MSVTGFNRRRREAAKKAPQAPKAEHVPKAQPEAEKPAESDSKPRRGRPRKTQE